MNKFDKLEKKVPMPKGGKVSDGYPTGGEVIPTPKAGETMTDKVRGQKRMLAEKRSTATCYYFYVSVEFNRYSFKNWR